MELFGHSRMAGKVTEKTIAAATFIQIDVPETAKQPAYSRLLNPSAIYAINPITEEAARELAGTINSVPVQSWDIREVVAKAKASLEAPKQPASSEEDDFGRFGEEDEYEPV